VDPAFWAGRASELKRVRYILSFFPFQKRFSGGDWDLGIRVPANKRQHFCCIYSAMSFAVHNQRIIFLRHYHKINKN
jgi:hypothetical protein